MEVKYHCEILDNGIIHMNEHLDMCSYVDLIARSGIL